MGAGAGAAAGAVVLVLVLAPFSPPPRDATTATAIPAPITTTAPATHGHFAAGVRTAELATADADSVVGCADITCPGAVIGRGPGVEPSPTSAPIADASSLAFA